MALNLKQSFGFHLKVFVDDIDREVFGCGEERIDAMPAEGGRHVLFFVDKPVGDHLMEAVLGALRRACGKVTKLDILEEDDQHDVLTCQLLHIAQLAFHPDDAVEIRVNDEQTAFAYVFGQKHVE